MKKLLIAVVALSLLMGSYFLGKNETATSSVLQDGGQGKVEPTEALIWEANATAMANQKPAIKNKLPLPPPNTPLNEVFYLLQKRADTGDSKAACRLAIELIQCQLAVNLSKTAAMSLDRDSENKVPANMRPEDVRSIDNAMDEHRLLAMEKALSCNLITEEKLKLATHYLRQAALASEPEAILPYVDGISLQGDGGMAMIHNPGFDTWRHDALPMAERALRQGIPEAAYMLGSAYSEDFSLFYGLVENNPLKAETMHLLQLRLEGKAFPVKTTLSAADYQRALSDSEAMFKDYYQGLANPKHKLLNRFTHIMTMKNDTTAPCE